ncbi:hypothetical protein [Streptacidiphilus sp. MAP12-33]|uniref:hypothetical protein n=1 Tax=Streptacidiphilus sp. MAP12-33 TaxID=3156266 RepID=UPI0035179272
MTQQTRCTYCGAQDLEPGFLDDPRGSGATKWIAGRLERGPLGGARRLGRLRREVHALRCTTCGHLELFALRE